MILFVGELLADMIAEESLETAKHFEMKVGGSPGNIASYLSQLGVKARILSRVGNDIIGKRIINKLRQKGVDTSYIQIDKEYGTTLVFVQKTKDTPDFFVLRGADRFINLPNNDLFNGIKILHLSCWTISYDDLFKKTVSILGEAIKNRILIGFDPNCRDKIFKCGKIDKEKVKFILKHTNFCKPSLDDAVAIFGEKDYSLEDTIKYYIDKFHALGVKNIALTAGKFGAYVSDGKNTLHIPSNAKKVVDATGAGDGFWAGMYYGILNGKNFVESCKMGSKVSAHILKFVGADVELSNKIWEWCRWKKLLFSILKEILIKMIVI